MIIPKKVKVGGLTFKVEIVDSLDGDDACGITDCKMLTIRLAKAPKESLEATFLHELIHAINREIGEIGTECIARGIYEIMKDNPNIFKYGK